MKNLFLYISLILIVSLASSCSKDCKENPIVDCVTTYEFNPVCGCNGKTYDNPSIAECMGIESYTSGACK